MKILLPASALLASLFLSQTLWAQNASSTKASKMPGIVATAPDQDDGVQPSRQNQRAEHLHHADSGSTIDEVRVGGEAKSISVKPAYNVPAYEVIPQKSRPDAASGQRVWNVLKF